MDFIQQDSQYSFDSYSEEKGHDYSPLCCAAQSLRCPQEISLPALCQPRLAHALRVGSSPLAAPHAHHRAICHTHATKQQPHQPQRTAAYDRAFPPRHPTRYKRSEMDSTFAAAAAGGGEARGGAGGVAGEGAGGELILHRWPGHWGLPSLSPQCIAVETYLRLAGLRFSCEDCKTPYASPSGQLPALDQDADVVGGTVSDGEDGGEEVREWRLFGVRFGGLGFRTLSLGFKT